MTMMDKYIFNNSSSSSFNTMAGFRVPFPRSPLRNRTAIRENNNHRHRGPSRAETISRDSGMATYRVTIPDRAIPGEEFDVYAGERIVRVRCPSGYKPGSDLQISVPLHVLKNEPEPEHAVDPFAKMPGDSDGVTRVLNQPLGEDAAYMVRIPNGVRGGQDFPVTILGQKLTVKCPNLARPGMSVRVVPPLIPDNDHSGDIMSSLGSNSTTTSSPPTTRQPLHKSITPPREDTQMFEVLVPKGVQPGHPFALRAGGVQVLVTCPKDAIVGQKIRFHLPNGLLKQHEGRKSEMAVIRLNYGEDSGWTRTIRATDMKFQWTRLDERGNVEERKRFDSERSAYVIKLDILNNDTHLRKGRVTLVTPDRGVVDSNIRMADGSDLICYSDIVSTQLKSYKDKVNWFHNKCDQLRVDWSQGFIRMNIRREYLLSDSIDSVMSLGRDDLRKTWRFEYQGEFGAEEGVDAGGLKREWFNLVTQAVFDPSMGLWQWSETNQMCMQINPASETCCPEDHLVCYRFIGRVMGKALFDREIVNGHMVKHMYKHILGFPVMLNDLSDLHETYAKSLMQITKENADYLCLNFTETEEIMGMKQMVELIPGGADTELTADNLPEYFEACLKYRMMGRYEAQLAELLLGFYDVIPAPLLTIFDFQELELLMCGLPTIDMNDWMTNTVYAGDYYRDGPNHQVCAWFWEVVSGYDQETKARLLQFVTGTSGVPSLGFGYLQSNDGDIRKFTIQGVPIGTCAFPRSHTCFNRIDLPLYLSKNDLEEKLKIAITMAGTGFDIE